jgi:DNA-binding transcriptional MerR regulator
LDNKAPDAFRTISEVADELDLPQHVLRFWESRFRDIKPMKRGGGRRYYRPDDVDLLLGIRHLLYGEGYTIRGVQRILREQGVRFVQEVWQEGAAQPPHGAGDDEETAEEAASATEMLEEERGLRGRLASLIGRDLGERRDDAEQRREPPMQSAPVPRVEPSDRAIHDVSVPRPEASLTANAAPRESASREGLSHGGLPRDDLRKLHSALHELAECRKLLEAATARAE